jgi:uncharacterized protein YndB with AHSA1/START domain
MEVRISRPVEAVWKALTDDIGAWWPDEFYAGGEPEKRSYHLEARPGGRMYEDWEGGGGVLWATVVAVTPAKQLQVMGTTFPNWGGPSIWFGTWDLESSGAATLLKFTESTVGRISDSLVTEKEKGWQFLFGESLKAHIEGKPRPEWKS